MFWYLRDRLRRSPWRWPRAGGSWPVGKLAVKRLSAVETPGTSTVVPTDKADAPAGNRVRAVALWTLKAGHPSNDPAPCGRGRVHPRWR